MHDNGRIYFFAVVICCVFIMTPVSAQTVLTTPRSDTGDLLAGEHSQLVYSGQSLILGNANPCTTSWIQTGQSEFASNSANRNISRLNPEVFTLMIKLSTYGTGDSVSISEGCFECAYDTNGCSYWNGDSSSVFIQEGAYNQHDYGIYRFEPLADTARGWLFPVRLLSGGYTRMIFTSDIADTCQVDWSLICEH